MFQQTPYGGQNPQSDFGFKPNTDNNQFGQNMFGSGLSRSTNTFGTTPFSTESQSNSGFMFGRNVQQPQQTTFGSITQPNAFGSNTSQSSTFGSAPAQTSAFGSAATQQQPSGIFSQLGGSGTGAGIGGFGQQTDLQRQQQGGAFGIGGSAGFTQMGSSGSSINKQFGGISSNIFSSLGGVTTMTTNCGTSNPQYSETVVSDPGSSNATCTMMHICAKQPYSSWSIGELRCKDYQLNRKPQYNRQKRPEIGSALGFGTSQSQQPTGVFGMNSNTSSLNLFDRGQQNNRAIIPFGTSNNRFGLTQQQPGVLDENSNTGASTTGMSVFGGLGNRQTTTTQPFTFGAQNQNVSGFRTATNPSSVFGAPVNTLTQPFSTVNSSQISTPNTFNPSSSQPGAFQSGFGLSSQNAASQRLSMLPLSQKGSLLQPSQTTSLGVQNPTSLTGQTQGFKPFGSQTQPLFGRTTTSVPLDSSLNVNKFAAPALGQTQSLFPSQPNQTLNTAPNTFTGSLFGSNPSSVVNQPFQFNANGPQTSSTRLQGSQGLQSANKLPLFGNTGTTSLFGDTSSNQLMSNTMGLSFPRQPLGATATPFSTFGTQNNQNKLFTSSIDKNPYGLFDKNAFPFIKTEKKTTSQTKSLETVRSDKTSASKVAEKYFSNIKLGAKFHLDTKTSCTSLPNIITPHDYARMESESRFSFRRPQHRLLVRGINTSSVYDDNGTESLIGKTKTPNGKLSSDLGPLLKNVFTQHFIDVNNNNSSISNKNLDTSPVDPKNSPDSSHSDEDEDVTKSLPFESEFVFPNRLKEIVYRPKFDPSLSRIVKMSDEELMRVSNFKIWADEVGSITFLEDVNIFDLVTDITVGSLWKKFNEIVKFMRRIVSVYPLQIKKHPKGKGLNLRAEISLKDCHPKLKSTSKNDSAVNVEYDAHVRSLEKATGTKFKSYNCDTGTWTFTVEHFTTYGFEVSSEEGDSKIGLISDDEPREPQAHLDACSIKRDKFRNQVGDSEGKSICDVSVEQPIVQLKMAPKNLQDVSDKKKSHSENIKDSNNNENLSNFGADNLSSGETFDESSIRGNKQKGTKRVRFALDTESSTTSYVSNDTFSKKVKGQSCDNNTSNYLDSPIRFLKQFKSELSLPSEHESFAVEVRNKSNNDQTLAAISSQGDGTVSDINLIRGYSFELKNSTVDLISSNRGMFGVCWAPHGVLITLARNKLGFSNKIIITKIDPFENASPIASKPDKIPTARFYDMLLSEALKGCSTVNKEHLCSNKTEAGDLSPPKVNTSIRQNSSLSSFEASLESTVSVCSVSTTATSSLQMHELSSKLVSQAFAECVNFRNFQKTLIDYQHDNSSSEHVSRYLEEYIDIFTLASILFDPLPESISSTMRNGSNFTHLCDVIKRNRLSSWLIDSLASKTKEMLNSVTEPHEKILALFLGGQVHKAIQVAQETKFYRLAAIMTQLCGAFKLKLSQRLPQTVLNQPELDVVPDTSYDVRGMDANVSSCIARQVCVWNNFRKKTGVKMYNSCINPVILNLWSLCSGRVGLWHSSIFAHIKDWKNAFALFFWYGGLCSWNISQSLKCYDDFCDKYSNIKTPHCRSSKDSDELIKTSPCYLLLKLFSGSNTDIRCVFHTKNYSQAALDCLIPWLICATLLSLTNDTTKAQCSNLYTSKLCHDREHLKSIFHSITHTLIFTLDVIGLWKWALYVSLFIESEEERKALIMLILMHNYPCSDSSGSSFSDIESKSHRYTASIFGEPQKTPHKDSKTYKFVTEALCIPPVWIHDTRSLRAFYDNDNLLYTTSQIDSGMLLMAYHSLAAGLFVNSIVSASTSLVKSLLEVLDQKTEASSAKDSITFLQRCIDVVETVKYLNNIKEHNTSSHNLHELTKHWKENLKIILEAFSKGMIPGNVVGMESFHKDNAVYHAILERFSYQYMCKSPYREQLSQMAHLTNSRRQLGVFICLSIIYERCIEMLFTLQHLYPDHFSLCADGVSTNSLLSLLLPSTSEFRIQKLRRAWQMNY